MRSTEFIIEDINELVSAVANISNDASITTELVNTVKQIKQNCQPFLNEIEDPFSLLRGLREPRKWALRKSVRLDGRIPMSTPEKLHGELNQIFKRRFGEPFRNAMFCTGSDSQASIYGTTFAIFPIGEYKYLWSTEYIDLYQSFNDWRSNDPQHDFVDSLNFDSYRTDKLNNAIASEHEIMIRTKNYYGLNMNHIRNDRNSGPILNAIQEYLLE